MEAIHEVIDRKTGAVVGKYKNKNRARSRANTLDLNYGAIRYSVRTVQAAPTRDDELKTGAQVLTDLLQKVRNIASDTYTASDEVADPSAWQDTTDYRQIAQAIDGALCAGLSAVGAKREGFLRAMAHLLEGVASGGLPMGDFQDWDHLGATARAFSSPSTSRESV